VGSESHGKRERERKRHERSSAKRARREARAESGDARESVDGDALMERFRVLSEGFAAGSVPREQYEAERLEIFRELGLDTDATSPAGPRP
jgi:hypothetical protein